MYQSFDFWGWLPLSLPSSHPSSQRRARRVLFPGRYEASKHTLVLIALVLVLHTTKFYGLWHHAKNMYREDAQPLLLVGGEGGVKRLPWVGKLFELLAR